MALMTVSHRKAMIAFYNFWIWNSTRHFLISAKSKFFFSTVHIILSPFFPSYHGSEKFSFCLYRHYFKWVPVFIHGIRVSHIKSLCLIQNHPLGDKKEIPLSTRRYIIEYNKKKNGKPQHREKFELN